MKLPSISASFGPAASAPSVESKLLKLLADSAVSSRLMLHCLFLSIEGQMTSFFELKRQLCPSTLAPEIAVMEPVVARKCSGARPILVPLKELRLHYVKAGLASHSFG